MAGQVNISGLSTGLNSGQVTIGPATFVATNAMCERLVVNLSSGDNTLTVPPLATAVLIVPATGNTQALKVRTSLNSGDAGLPISASDPAFFSFRALSPTTVIINAAGTVNGVELTFV